MGNTDVGCSVDWRTVQKTFYQKIYLHLINYAGAVTFFIQAVQLIVLLLMNSKIFLMSLYTMSQARGRRTVRSSSLRENNNEYRILYFQDQNLEVDLGTELFEEVLVLVETDGQEVEQVSDVHIVCQAEERMSQTKTNK